MAKYKIVAQGRPNLTVDFTFEMEGLQGVEVQLVEANAMSNDEFLETAKDADALIVRGMPVTEKVINRLEKCKIIALGSVGTDIVDVRAATARGIPVTNCPDTFIQEVAEHTAVLILAAYRRLLLMDKLVREQRWSEGRPTLYQLPRLYGQTLGLISFGNIPRAVVPLMKPFGLRILAYDPFVKETTILQHGAEPVSLTELLQKSDIVSKPSTRDRWHDPVGRREAVQADEVRCNLREHRQGHDRGRSSPNTSPGRRIDSSRCTGCSGKGTACP